MMRDLGFSGFGIWILPPTAYCLPPYCLPAYRLPPTALLSTATVPCDTHMRAPRAPFDDADDHRVDGQLLVSGVSPRAGALRDQHDLAFAAPTVVDATSERP